MGTDQSAGEGANFDELPPFSVRAQGHDLMFYPRGKDRLDRLLSLIAEADRAICICFYIFAQDVSGTAVRDGLVAAARRGVRVTLIVDGFGASVDTEFLQPLSDAGGRYYLFSARWSQRYLIRNHQKMVIVDGKTAMLGGFNVSDDYFAPPEVNGWSDLAVSIEGPIVEALSRWFGQLEQWTAKPRGNWRAIAKAIRIWKPVDGPVQLLIGGPTSRLSSWAKAVARDIEHGNRLDMVMAYFSPASGMSRRIGRLARRGTARLVMAGKSDNNATIGATRSMYHYFLRRGVRVWEFTPCKLHTKLIVVDDAVYFGSANFDMRSLFVNLELMIRIEDAHLADRMRDYIAHHRAASLEITPQLNKQRATVFNRLRWNIAWFLVAVVDYNVTRRLNLGL